MPDFLLEIGCEEIPARMIDRAVGDLYSEVVALLRHNGLVPELPEYGSTFATPRRLALLLPSIYSKQQDTTERIIGPSVKIAFRDGEPTEAAASFSRKVGIPLSSLERISTGKGEYISVVVSREGKSAQAILQSGLAEAIRGIQWPKSMYWRKPSERFVRPVRWLVAMLDGEVVPLEFDGVTAGNQSRGHRILSPSAVAIPRAGSAYVDALRQAKVLNRSEREQQIRKGLDAATRAIPGARWREDKGLLDTVVNLTEFPSVIRGNFDPEFLELPEEVLVTVMRDHQKYFAIEDADGKLLPHFLAVLNTDADPQQIIQHGHERVLRARFNDARFFWQTDQKHPLRERVAWLKHVTFQKDLGSYYEKTMRVQRLCRWLSASFRRDGVAVRAGVVHKAACLAKADLTTEVVKEFTELQGIVGGLYARVQELDPDMKGDAREAIALAIYDQYKPESMEDSVPRTVEGSVLSMADKADSITGMFALGLQPTGSKDPFALRRQANGIVKILAEKNLALSLEQLFSLARDAYDGSAAEAKFASGTDWEDAVRGFLRERLEFYLREALGLKYDVVKATLAADSDDVVDAVARAEAVREVLHLPEFQAIAAASKRMRNILKQAAEKGFPVAVRFARLPEAAAEENMLGAYLENNAPRIEAHRRKKEYGAALNLLSTAREPVDAFFDKVMVMAEDERIRANRLALLQALLKEFSTIADFSEIVTEGSKESSK